MLENKGLKYDEGKLRYDLVPEDALEQIVHVLTFGANKYEARNWEKGMDYGRVYAAAQRHLSKFWQGHNIDPETNLHHLAHAGCCILFLLTFELRRIGKDDRKIACGTCAWFDGGYCHLNAPTQHGYPVVRETDSCSNAKWVEIKEQKEDGCCTNYKGKEVR